MKKILLVGLLMTLAACSSSSQEDTNTELENNIEVTDESLEEQASAPVVQPVDLAPVTEETTTEEAQEEVVTEETATEEAQEEVVTQETTTEEAQEEVVTQEATTEEAQEEVVTEEAVVAPLNLTVDSFDFGYSSTSLSAKVGQEVTITLTNSGSGSHNFVIDALNVNSGVISGGQSTTFTFTPQEAGTFEFYCSIGSHRQMGMLGTLVVSE